MQPEAGRFRAQVSAIGLEQGMSATLRVAVRAEGYEPLEHDVTLHADAQWPALELALMRKRADAADEDAGTEGRLPPGFVGPGLVSWWWSTAEEDARNTRVCRGVPVTAAGHPGGLATVDGEGRFRLRGSWREELLCLHRPALPPKWFWPVRDGP